LLPTLFENPNVTYRDTNPGALSAQPHVNERQLAPVRKVSHVFYRDTQLVGGLAGGEQLVVAGGH
jgi:hypothetical protein